MALVILEEDHRRFLDVLGRLREEANAAFTFLLDRAGQEIASCGQLKGGDPTALASLTAGNVAATEGLAQLIGDDEFTTLYHEGPKDSMHISLVSERMILLVLFDAASSLGLVRLRVQQITPALSVVADEVLSRPKDGLPAATAFATSFDTITDEDIDALFG